MKRPDNFIIFALIFLGITSLIAQVLLIRELIIAFYGNELFLGLALALWLFSTGIGSLGLAKLFKQASIKALFWLYQVFPIILFSAYLLIRIARVILAEPGVIPNLLTASAWTLLVISPVGLLLGVLFVVIVKEIKRLEAEAVTKGYIIESLGFLAGALIFNFLLIKLPALTAIGVIAVISLLLALQLSFKTYLKSSYIITVLIILVAIGLGWTQAWDQDLLSWHFSKETITASLNSKYNSIVITNVNDQNNFYLNGQLADNDQNKYHNELITHYPLVLQEKPERILLIGNGVTGAIDEIEKYRVKQIDYLELDKDYYDALVGTLDFRQPANTQVIYRDARSFLNSTKNQYDAVIINYSNPNTLAENRYFTREFFSLIKQKLESTGKLSILINTTPNYTVGAQNQLLASLYQTLKAEFAYVKVFADNDVVFIASPSEIKHNMNVIENRFEEYSLKNQYLHSGYLYWRIYNDRSKALTKALESTNAPVNSEFKPTLYFYNLQTFLEKMDVDLRLISIVVLFFFLFLFFIFFFLKNTQITNYQLLITSAIPDFSLISFEILLVLLFQTYNGVLYTQLALVIALILFGIAIGSYVFSKRLEKISETKLIRHSYLIITLSFTIPLLIVWQLPSLLNYQLIFYILSLLAGFAVGTKFPVINKLYLQKNTNIGAVYGADLIGGSIGALLAGTVLMPVLGVMYSIGLFVLLSGIGLLYLLISLR